MSDWVVAGGKTGEIAHCTRCGEGLENGSPQPLYMLSAMTEAFAKQHARCRPGQWAEPRAVTPKDWFKGRDTGKSSFTIFYVMTKTTSPHRQYSVPLDPADFGRCHRVLQLFPEWKGRLSEVAAKFPEWGPLIEHWDELTRMYEKELPTGRAPELYARMKELIEEGKVV